MTTPLTPEEKRRRLAVLAQAFADPEFRREYQQRQADRFMRGPEGRDNVRVGKVEWSNPGTPEPPSGDGDVHRQLPVEKHMLNEQTWISEHQLGEKA
jgi:hypothetical protein